MGRVLALSPAAGTTPVVAPCPGPGMVAPRYPANRLKGGTSGKTIVLARIDECGRVVEAKVDRARW